MKNQDKYFFPLGFLYSLFGLCLGFSFFFSGARLPSLVMIGSASFSLLLLGWSLKNSQKNNYLRPIILLGLHLGFLYASIISGGLFSPLIWLQLIFSPMAHQFLLNKKYALILSALIYFNLFILFIWQSLFELPINHLSGPASSTLQFIMIISVAGYFSLQGILKAAKSDF